MEPWGVLVPPPPEVDEWLRQAAIPLDTVEPGSGFEDLAPLGDIIGDSRLVALGEATHGSREFFLFKHRVLEYCVSELDFDFFGIEANYPECLAIDEYARTGHGDPSTALLGQFFWTWDTEEVLNLIEWIRSWNTRHSRPKPVRFFGFDMQFGHNAAHAVMSAAAEIEPTLPAWLSGTAAMLTSELFAQNYPLLDAQAKEEFERALDRLCELALRGADRPEMALTCEVLRQWIQMHSSSWTGANHRDRSMADNASRLLDLAGPGSRGVLWAHNGHIQRPAWAGRYPAMGGYLNDRFGPEYLSIGLTFGQGGFQAMDYRGSGLRDWEVELPPVGTFDRALADVGIPLFALDLRDWSKIPDEVAVWLERAPAHRSIGAVFGEDHPPAQHTAALDPRHPFDVIVHVDRTTPARRIERGGPSRSTTPAAEPHTSAVNLDFGDWTDGGAPTGWLWRAGDLQGIGGHELLAGEQTGEVRISRSAAPWKAGEGVLFQTLSGESLVGRSLTLRAECHATTGIGSAAWVSMSALGAKPPAAFAPPPRLAQAVSAPIKSEGPSPVELRLTVPEGTVIVVIALRLAGDGEATFGGLALAV